MWALAQTVGRASSRVPTSLGSVPGAHVRMGRDPWEGVQEAADHGLCLPLSRNI